MKKRVLLMLSVVFITYCFCGCGTSDRNKDAVSTLNPDTTKEAAKTENPVQKVAKEDEREITDRDFNRDDYYISITVSEETEEGGLFSAYCYDLGSNESWRVWSHDNFSQYAIMLYDWPENKVYYLQNEGFDENMHLGCDSICSYDLATGRSEVLMEDFYAINYILPAGNKLNIVAVERGDRPLSFFQYDKTTREVTRAEELDKDLNVWNISYSPVSNKGYIAGYLEDELDAKMDEANENQTWLYAADRYVYASDDGFSTLDFCFKTEGENIDKLAVTPKGKLYYTKSEYEVYEYAPYLWYKYSAGDEILNESYFRTVDNLRVEKDYIVFMDDVHMYCIGSTNEEGRGIYCYNVEEQTAEKLFSVENGFINNFRVLKKD